MNKINKKKISIFVCLFLVSIFVSSTKTYAQTTEAPVGEGAGGVPLYYQYFEDQTGILIVAPTKANDTGASIIDITVLALCQDNRTFRLQVYDSDQKTFISPENELGIKQKQRRFTVQPHMDALELIWQVRVTSEDGSIVYASIVLRYWYEEEADIYNPIGQSDSISLEEYQEEVRKLKIQNAIGYTIMAVLGGLFLVFYIRRRF